MRRVALRRHHHQELCHVQRPGYGAAPTAAAARIDATHIITSDTDDDNDMITALYMSSTAPRHRLLQSSSSFAVQGATQPAHRHDNNAATATATFPSVRTPRHHLQSSSQAQALALLARARARARAQAQASSSSSLSSSPSSSSSSSP